MHEAPQHDPNVPDPNKPWCPECEEHVDLAAKQQSISYSSASFTGRYSHRCKSCKTKVFVAGTSAALRHPYLKRLVSVSKITSYFLIGVGLVSSGIAILITIRDFNMGHHSLGIALFIGGFATLVIMVGCYAPYYHWVLRPNKMRRKWLAWARERGYTGN